MPAERRYEASSTLGEKEEGCETGMRAMIRKMFKEECMRAETKRVEAREKSKEASRVAREKKKKELLERQEALVAIQCERQVALKEASRVAREKKEASRVAREKKEKELLERQEALVAIRCERQVALMKLRAEISERAAQVLEEEQRKAVKAYGEEQAEWGEAARNYVQVLYKQKEYLAIMEADQRRDLEKFQAESRRLRAARSQLEEQECLDRKEEESVVDILDDAVECLDRKEEEFVVDILDEAVECLDRKEEEFGDILEEDLVCLVESKDVSQGERKEEVGVALVSDRKSSDKSIGKGKPVEGGPEPDATEEATAGQSVEDGSLVEKEEELVGILAAECLDEKEDSEVGGAYVGGACVAPAVTDSKLDSSGSASSVVGRVKEELEASHQPVVGLTNLCSNFVSHQPVYGEDFEREGQPDGVFAQNRRKKGNRRSSELKQFMEPMEQSRATEFSVVGGDVGSAHRRREKDRVQMAHDSAD